MTTKRFPIYRDAINLIMLYLIVMSADMTLSSGMQFYIPASEYAAIGAVLTVSYLLREHITKMYIYLICHAVMVAACIMVPIDITSKVKIVFIAIVVCAFDIYNWFNGLESMPDIFWGCGGLILLAFFMSSGAFEFGYSKIIFNMGILFVTFLLVRMLISNFYDLSRSGQLTDDMPVRELFKNNTYIAAGIILLAIAFMIFVRTDELIQKINDIVYLILKRFWLVIMPFVTAEEGSIDYGMARPKMPDLPAAEDNIFAQLLRILEALLSVMIAALLIYFIFKLIMTVIRVLTKDRLRRYRSHRSYRVKNEVRERLSRTDTTRESRKSVFKTNIQKVRQIYRKELISYKKKGANIKQTRTPFENRSEVLRSKGNDISDATRIYEKVRFCVGYEVLKQDVTDIRNAFRK
jgi:hypothetical protein